VARNVSPTRKSNYRAVERELWMLSGNECAHAGCTSRMVTESGAYIGEIAHIRGVKPTAARHDPTMSDEDLRDKSNLVLLCHEHHIETDDEKQYPVARMQKMKELHEARFRKAYKEFELQFTDYTDDLHPMHCRTLERWRDVLGLQGDDFDQTYFETEARRINALADKLSSLTDEARRLFCFVVAKGSVDRFGGTFHFPLSELSRRTKTGKSKIADIFDELQRLDFGSIHWPEHGDSEPPEVVVYGPTEDQRFHSEILVPLRHFCEQTRQEIETFIVHLRFDLLDA
jgi:hypothetical protein